jgi:molybdenum cofactor cytidylyltransferase
MVQGSSHKIRQFGIVLLAAGASARLGNPKQLVLYKGKTLLQHTLDVALELSGKVFVILGAGAAEVQKELETGPARVILNEQWEEGIGSSIRSGVECLKAVYPDAEGVMFLVCDQPHLTATILRNLIARQHETRRAIVASTYSDATGIPALFHRKYFQELEALKGDAGAKKLMLLHPEEVASIDFPLGSIDIDTPDDYKKLSHD